MLPLTTPEHSAGMAAMMMKPAMQYVVEQVRGVLRSKIIGEPTFTIHQNPARQTYVVSVSFEMEHRLI